MLTAIAVWSTCVLCLTVFGQGQLSASSNPVSNASFSWSFEPDSNIIFHAYLIEKNHEIITYPPLRVTLDHGAKLCQLHLLPTDTHRVPSFISPYVSDSVRGFGDLHLNESALYQARLQNDPSLEDGVYHLKVLAEDCSSPPRLTPTWTINVVLVPTEQPVWSEKYYSFSVPSNLPAGSVVGKVTAYAAFDLDRGPDFLANRLGDDTGMCAYGIEHPSDSLFDVDGHGVIRSRASLQSASSEPIQQTKRYDLNVTGFDCHLPVSRRSTVAVSVFIRPQCAPHWQDLNEELVYPALAAPQPVSPTATLQTCNSSSGIPEHCELEQGLLRVKILWTAEDRDRPQEHSPSLADYCDLDVLSLRAQRHLCGFSLPNTVELLPSNTSSLSRERPIDSVLSFNGSTAWSVPQSVIPLAHHRLDNVSFTLTFWMNHSVVGGLAETGSHDREHIV